MTSPRLTCRELIEFLGQYLEGDLPGGERERFDAHLAICASCRDYLAGYRETIRLGQRACAPEQEIPDGVPAELVAAILASRTRR
jgi:anti-sigma factor RsiW